jgi:preprotein translocase subunit SecG
MFTFLLIVQTLIAASLVGVILMQRSEGGGLGVGSSSAGLMTARGAADFLTRATAILATLFVALSIFLAGYATMRVAPKEIDTSLARQAPATAPGQQLPGTVPLANDNPLDGVADAVGNGAAATPTPPPGGRGPAETNQAVPLAK